MRRLPDGESDGIGQIWETGTTGRAYVLACFSMLKRVRERGEAGLGLLAVPALALSSRASTEGGFFFLGQGWLLCCAGGPDVAFCPSPNGAEWRRWERNSSVLRKPFLT